MTQHSAAMEPGVLETTASAPSGNRALRGLVRGGLLNLLGAALSSLVNVAFVVVAARTFSRADNGIYFATTSFFLVAAAVARLGAPTGTVYFVARLLALGEPHRVRACLRSALVPVCLVAAVAALVLLALAGPIGSLLVSGEPGRAVSSLRLLAVLLPLAVASDVALAATRGFGAMLPFVVVEKVARPVAQMLGLLVVVVVWRHGPVALVAAWVVPYAASAVAGLVALRRLLLRNAGQVRNPAYGMGREFWRFTAPRAITSVAQVVLQRLDVVLLAAMRGPAEAAVYGAVTRFLVVGQLGGQAIGTTVQPRLSALLARGQLAETGSVYKAATCWLVLATWPLYLLVAVSATVATQLFGRAYAQGSDVVLLLMLVMLVATAAGPVDSMLDMAGRTRWTLANGLLALSVNAGLNVLLIPRHGINGAAVAWVAAILVNNLLPLAQLRLFMRLHPYGRAPLLAMCLALMCFGVVPLLIRQAWNGGVTAVLLGALAGGLLYVPALWRWRSTFDLDQLRHR